MPGERLARFAWLVLAYNLLVILWGAVVRATGSGAGCGSHWPLCDGEVVPRAPDVETWIEFSHRVTSGLALFAVMVLLALVWRHLPRGHRARKAALWSAIFMLGEAAVGAALVLFELVADNESMARAMFMGAHLLNTFLLLASLVLTALWIPEGRSTGGWNRAPWALRWPLAAALGGLMVVGASGAVSALGDTLYPSASLGAALADDLSMTGHLLIRLRVLHPLLAAVVGVYLLFLCRPAAGARPAGRAALWVQLSVLLQVAAGLLNVLLLAPVILQLAHLLLADLVWLAVVCYAAERWWVPASSGAPSAA